MLDPGAGYPTGTVTDPTGTTSGVYSVRRGGSWLDGDAYCRAACRYIDEPGSRRNRLGFRPALVPSK